jgi:hypothetical protein
MSGKFFEKFTVFDLILLAFMAALGIAVKPVFSTLTHLITGPLMIPGGSFAGGLYMLFMILGAGLVRKRGSATLIALVQALIVMVTGISGSHGVASLLTYGLPGLVVDILWVIMRHNGCCCICCFFGGMAANITGAFMVNVVFFSLPVIPLLLSLALAAFSGGLGGVIAWNLIKPLKKFIR